MEDNKGQILLYHTPDGELTTDNSQIAFGCEYRVIIATAGHRVGIEKCDRGIGLGFPIVNTEHIANAAGVYSYQIGTSGLAVCNNRPVADGILAVG